jgi:hypothetical protein
MDSAGVGFIGVQLGLFWLFQNRANPPYPLSSLTFVRFALWVRFAKIQF